MKKLLALVLALVMTMSLAVSANAFTDDKDVKYTEAVEVLADMGILKGYENGSFNPNGNITRAEAAAILYRVYTKDVAEKSKDLYAGYGKFADVTSAYSWAAGVIGYCANAEIIKGYNETTFGPADSVTGYQILAMLLRAVGYDKNGEFTGNGWETQVAKVAQQAGVLVNVGTENLAQPASRQLVAELVFRTLFVANQVTYTPAFGYVSTSVVTTSTATLGTQNFDLAKTNGHDDWGRPWYGWKYNVGAKLTSWNYDCVSYTTAQTQCNIAKDIDLEKKDTFTTYTNGLTNVGKQEINPLATKATVGAQGKLVEVYPATNEIVIIDTYLAKVTNVVDAKYDKAGHLKSEAAITLYVYTGKTAVDEANGTKITLTNGETNYTYAKGDMLLINLNVITENSEILGLATSVNGYQSLIWRNAAKHTVDGTTYDDACQFNFDQAGENKANYCWYFDQYGNLIGAVLVKNVYNYAVLKNIVWVNNGLQGGYATGTLVYMDGSENEVTIAEIAGLETAYLDAENFGTGGSPIGYVNEYFYVTTNTTTNARLDGGNWIAGHLLSVDTDSDGYVYLNKAGTEEGGKHTELTNVDVYTKGTKIGGDNGIAVDNGTQFLVLTSDGFKTYTGIKNVPNMVDCTVDYVLGADGVAAYVYVLGTDASVNSNSLVLITSDGYNYTVSANKVYTLNLYGDEDYTIKTMDVEIVNTLTAKDAVNKLFFIEYTDGLAVKVTAVEGDAIVTIAKDGTRARQLPADQLTYAEGVLTWTVGGETFTWNVDEVEVKGVELTEGMSFEDTLVYVVYNVVNGQRTASTLYIVDIAD